VSSFLKEKRLIGDQSLELVRKIKGEPGFTFKDAFLTGRVKKSKEALFTTIIQAKALEHNINFDVKTIGNHNE